MRQVEAAKYNLRLMKPFEDIIPYHELMSEPQSCRSDLDIYIFVLIENESLLS